MTDQNKSYLGDGLYAHFDGYQIWLTTPQGMEVALEPQVQDEFFRYVGKIYGCKVTIDHHDRPCLSDPDPGLDPLDDQVGP